MSLGEKIIRAIRTRRDRRLLASPGPLGNFYRAGGNAALYDVPVLTGELVIDAGGYEGEWTAEMVVRYGCRSEIFEPVPVYAELCRARFRRNALINVHQAALGSSARTAIFSLAANGTSEFRHTGADSTIHAKVVDVSTVLAEVAGGSVACLKLNIEGGEYNVLERLIETGQIERCRSLLLQFHAQPVGWEERYHAIVKSLAKSHALEWGYPLVWEKWVASQAI